MRVLMTRAQQGLPLQKTELGASARLSGEETLPRERLPGGRRALSFQEAGKRSTIRTAFLGAKMWAKYLRMSQVALLECDVFSKWPKRSLFCCLDPICSQLGLACLGQGEMADLIHSSPGMFIGYILHKRLGRCLKILDKSENDSPWLTENSQSAEKAT